MRLEALAGTDAACVCLYDPAALPDDFDQRFGEDPRESLEAAQSEGRAFFTETGGDGSYLLHVYVGEPMPEGLFVRADEPVEMELQVPSGELVFCGAEYAHKHRSALAERHPQMLDGSRMRVPPGTYRATFWRTEWSDDDSEGASRLSLVAGLGTGAWILALVVGVALLFTPWRWALVGYVPVLVVALLALVRLQRHPELVRARETRERLEREMPSLVLELQGTGPPGPSS